ncbi:MAG: hypothetical protein AB7J13_07375 [Pyrinomonadaceae bacterium]
MITSQDDVKPHPTQKREGATLEEAEIRRLILNGQINASDMTVAEREKYREEIKRARRY